MSRPQTIFICEKCGAQSPKWSGRCFNCGGWGSLKEEIYPDARLGSSLRSGNQKIKNLLKQEAKNKIVSFDSVKGEDAKRIRTGIEEVDRILGGGIVPGAVILMAGEPGVGKSTLVAQMASALQGRRHPEGASATEGSRGRTSTSSRRTTRVSRGSLTLPRDSSSLDLGRGTQNDNTVLYISGEESASQLKMRFDRLNLATKNLKYLGETEAGMIAAAIEEIKPALTIIDSIQTIRSDEVLSEAGSVNQIKVSTAKIADAAKSNNVPAIIIGHITKEGRIAGPKTLEHIVDVVLNLEGDRVSQSRILRTPKNRFGSTDEVGIFKMTETGLAEVQNPSELFLEGRSAKSGSIITCVMEGTRPILVEVQALLERSSFRFPQRRASGFDINRLQIIATTLAKRAGLYLFKYNIHLNIVGGLKIKEPSTDLAVALAITSAYFNRAIDPKIVAFGEIGLGGEIRPAANLEKRLKEAEKMGFKYIITNPGGEKSASSVLKKSTGEILSAKNINEAIEIIK